MGCIYKITVGAEQRPYIGSTADLSKRMYYHLWNLKRGTHHCIKLRRAVRKYGLDALSVEVLEEVENSRLIEREQFWLDAFKGRLLNTCPTAQSRLGAKMPAEAKRIISERLRGNKYRLGIPHDDASRKKISDGLLASYARGRKRAKGNAALFAGHMDACRAGLRQWPRYLTNERIRAVVGHRFFSGSNEDTAKEFGITKGSVWAVCKMLRDLLDDSQEAATGMRSTSKYRSLAIHPDWYDVLDGRI